MLTQEDLRIATLGEPTIPSPIHRGASGKYVPDTMRVLYDIECHEGSAPPTLGFEKAGPREKLFFDPARCRAAIVTCGGLCPGLNNIIRNLFYTLHSTYGVPQVLGIRNGFAGLNPATGPSPVWLTSDMVEHIHHMGGTILGTSRGPQDPSVMVDFLRSHGVNLLFTIGGDGTQSGAHKIAQEAQRRGAKIAVVGIPKTIDNDIKYCYRTFGFLSAISEAERVIDRAHVEAKSVVNGVGLVKLMGREAGFIAAASTIASGEVNFTLIPEVPFELQGPGGLLAKLEARLRARQHAVIVVAEGAGQHLLTQHSIRTDASGNPKLGDIGVFLKEQVTDHFRGREIPVSVKYFDPSYYIRSVHAGAADSLLCEQLARYAAHAALAGKTDLLVSLWHEHTVHVPLAISTGEVKRLDTSRDMWNAVLAITGQERW
ncbi:Pyrophosphate--fructose 6-phosphate 1-phosphotransferase [Pirellulimonas nuda]|uniref:Pyrophosphate--fructose 6-phosphate 1-phosphotransferase n=1 Tax=Pirellulimonas nuda TaxID=2528009 RepID=A0A518DGU6_9BACT|nr:ATP-dependent 6-phosphofructokinase [Pirellulimonas nuda]QDU90701.1 Pyrophosphate--fructose 6-phosphate 1-phosphotransferase [Pirellulimonas nuda]